MKKVSAYIAAAFLSLVVCRSDAFATPIVFDVFGQFDNGATLDGTLTIDTATGVATGANFSLGAPVSVDLTGVVSQGAIIDHPTLVFEHGLTQFILLLPKGSLVGYAGGHFCAIDTPCEGSASLLSGPYASLLNGFATPADAPAVPEPATLILVGSGVLGLVGRWRRCAAGR